MKWMQKRKKEKGCTQTQREDRNRKDIKKRKKKPEKITVSGYRGRMTYRRKINGKRVGGRARADSKMKLNEEESEEKTKANKWQGQRRITALPWKSVQTDGRQKIVEEDGIWLVPLCCVFLRLFVFSNCVQKKPWNSINVDGVCDQTKDLGLEWDKLRGLTAPWDGARLPVGLRLESPVQKSGGVCRV